MTRPRSVSIDVEMRVDSRANRRGHWRAFHSEDKARSLTIRAALSWHEPIRTPCEVTIDVVRPVALDSDNLASACKDIRDEVASWLSVDDRSHLVRWIVRLERGSVREHRVRIQAVELTEPPERPTLLVLGREP